MKSIDYGPHYPACRKWIASQRGRITIFLKRYPRYCRTCGAIGYRPVLNRGFDWQEWDEEPCEVCLSLGKCPRCMTLTIKEKTRVYHTWNQCTTCGWRDGDETGDRYCHPYEPECSCSWVIDQQVWAQEEQRYEEREEVMRILGLYPVIQEEEGQAF